jgi:hypothetical protein
MVLDVPLSVGMMRVGGLVGGGDMSGVGIVDSIRKLYRVGQQVGEAGAVAKKYGKEVSDFAFGEAGTAFSNMLPNSDDNARPQYPGEHHAVMKLPNGRFGRANYMGRGTKVIKRLKLNDPGRTPSDMVAKRHDIDYSLAKDVGDVRKADKRMLASLKRIQSKGLDSRFNIEQGSKLIGAKVMLENMGVDPRKFTSFGDPGVNKGLLEAERGKLDLEGYGKKKKRVAKKLPPGVALRRKLLAKSSKQMTGGKTLGKALKKAIYDGKLEGVILKNLLRLS